jgi:MATE family multidrug resistance protein
VSARTTLRELLVLAWPVVVARSSQAVIGFCDALMTAPLGETSLAAVTTGAMNVYAVAILPMGVVFIVQSFAAQLSGRGELPAARRYAYYGLAIAAATMVVGAAAIPGVTPALAALGYAGEVRAQMAAYLSIRLLGVGAVVGVEALGNWFGGLGHTRPHMVAGVIAMVVNVALNWVLIHGHLGAPALGVEGAALASVIATWVGLAALAVPFARGWVTGKSASLGLRRAELARVIRFGVPNGIIWFLEFSAFTVFVNVVVADLGTTALAALMVVININAVSFMPAFGLASAGAILVGTAIGAGRAEAVPAIVRMTIRATALWQGAVGLLYLLAPRTVVGWFVANGEVAPLHELGATMLHISVGWQLFDAVALTVGEALRAAGDTAWSMWARIALGWTLFVPAALISVRVAGGGHVAAMLCLVGYLALLALALAWRFRSGAWQRIDLTGMPLAPM